MRTQNLQLLSSVLLVATAVAVSAGPGKAAPPETPRYFAEWTIDPLFPCADWEAEESKRIVAHRDGGGAEVIDFLTLNTDPRLNGPYTDDHVIVTDTDGNVIIDLQGTRWVRMPVLHVTNHGAEQIRYVYWLEEDLDGDGDLDPAVPGMTAPTGLNGGVMNVVTIRIARIDSSDSYFPNKFRISAGTGVEFCIALGMFQK
jgi:hypothetical protein